ncbi:Uncharacterized conserved protein YafD, endonuclease/exonuclease/phosphatase (EEP) superfamily [Syntrophus gentianae]|uniref:Uncharacterized conserved protein YafD, endonuclease/exonuclease/phosphatase (EEP) superfamily n=1 Tax=Syntrophus gentianae TaxID=43775 RepID=A0A1H7XVP4_9BACT|nr:endonuclease/exonuclease/phosphatase family protein [Syntrophus gentianae]SEM38032.1 Uncharacterized conserved protein YafD, endonuclease/exonuclease/phosphatase (EEP) superfamily [Syntrophus gentianae]
MKAAVLLRVLTGFYGLILGTITVLNWKGPDFFWLGALNLYLPQVFWTVPGIILAGLTFKADRSWTWLPLLCVLWVLGPIMGFCWSPDQPEPAPGSLTLRVMTWNTKYKPQKSPLLIDEITLCNPDVVLFQDASGSMRGPLGKYFRTWNVYTSDQYVIASRYPLSHLEIHELPFSGRWKQQFLSCRLSLGSTVISLYNIHFVTPRQSLNAIKATRRRLGDLPEAGSTLENNVRNRIAQADAVRELLRDESGPVILAGDLNAPDPSRVCATLREAGLHDAFAEGGKGYGYTYGHFLLKDRYPWLRVSWMRIDHIMVSSGFTTRRCWAGSGRASDHRPVIADLILKKP